MVVYRHREDTETVQGAVKSDKVPHEFQWVQKRNGTNPRETKTETDYMEVTDMTAYEMNKVLELEAVSMDGDEYREVLVEIGGHDVRTMSDNELRFEMDRLATVLDFGPAECWDEAYGLYTARSYEVNRRYYEENISSFNKFVRENIEGKRWEDIPPETRDYYSDWHKDMYGFRP